MTFAVGETVGPYQIISPLGEGGMASVYKAYHANLDRYVAIKVMHPGFKEDKTFISRFQREARVLARLDHPNIVPIFDFAEHEGQPYLVMKYIEGGTLKDRLALHAPSLPETLTVVDTVGSALAYAHQQGILHRDIKPSNIIITPENHYYLSDFGLARLTSAGESTLSQDALLGTPNYISPEQARGQTDLDGRTDIYSFGIVLYEMIVGRVPFSGNTPYSIVHDHIYTPLPPPSSINPKVSEPLEKFLLKALAKDREDRFANVSTMMLAFRKAIGGLGAPSTTNNAALTEDWPAVTVVAPNRTETVKAPPEPLPASTPVAATPKPTPKRRWWLIGGALALVVCLGLGGLAWVGRLTRENRARGTATAEASLTLAARPTQVPQAITDPISDARATQMAAPDSIEANWRLGKALYDGGRSDLAVGAYATAAALAKYRVVFYTSHITGQYANDPLFVLAVLSDGIKNSKSPAAQLELWNLAAPFFAQAVPLPNSDAVLTSIATDFPDRPEPTLALARHLILFQHLAAAKPYIDYTLSQFPDNPLTHLVYGEYLLAAQKFNEAQAEFKIVIADPNAGPAVVLAAQQHLKELKGTVTP